MLEGLDESLAGLTVEVDGLKQTKQGVSGEWCGRAVLIGSAPCCRPDDSGKVRRTVDAHENNKHFYFRLLHVAKLLCTLFEVALYCAMAKALHVLIR